MPLKIVGHYSDTSDTEREDGCSGSPRMQRRRRKRNKSPGDFCDDLTYVDTLPEVCFFFYLFIPSDMFFFTACTVGRSDVKYLGNKVQNSRSCGLCSGQSWSS